MKIQAAKEKIDRILDCATNLVVSSPFGVKFGLKSNSTRTVVAFFPALFIGGILFHFFSATEELSCGSRAVYQVVVDSIENDMDESSKFAKFLGSSATEAKEKAIKSSVEFAKYSEYDGKIKSIQKQCIQKFGVGVEAVQAYCFASSYEGWAEAFLDPALRDRTTKRLINDPNSESYQWLKVNLYPLLKDYFIAAGNLRQFATHSDERFNAIFESDKGKLKLEDIRIVSVDQVARNVICAARFDYAQKTLGSYSSQIKFKAEKTMDKKIYVTISGL